MYSCGPSSSGRFGLSAASPASAIASLTIVCSPASLKSRVLALPDFWPMRTVTVTLRSYCTRLVVIDEFAQRVPDRSPPVRFTSTASAFAMLMILSTMALTWSLVYMPGRLGTVLWGVNGHSWQRGRYWQFFHTEDTEAA